MSFPICYFCEEREATTTRTRPDGAVKDCPACRDCADIIDEQAYNDAQAAVHESYVELMGKVVDMEHAR